MIRYKNRATIVRMRGPPGAECVAVAARAPAGPGCGGRWLTGRPGG